MLSLHILLQKFKNNREFHFLFLKEKFFIFYKFEIKVLKIFFEQDMAEHGSHEPIAVNKLTDYLRVVCFNVSLASILQFHTGLVDNRQWYQVADNDIFHPFMLSLCLILLLIYSLIWYYPNINTKHGRNFTFLFSLFLKTQ